MGGFSLWHWLIVLVIVVLVFGTKRLGNVGKDLGEGFGPGVDGGGTDQQRAASGHFGQGGGVGADDRRAAGLGFEDGQAEAFEKRREGQDLGAAVEQRHFFARHVAQAAHPGP